MRAPRTTSALAADTPERFEQEAPLAFADLAWIEAVPVEDWSRLFNHTGWPDGLRPANASHASIYASVQGSLPDPLLDALQLAYDLGSADGVEELMHTAKKDGLNADVLGDFRQPVAALFRLWQAARQPGRRRLGLVLRLAQLALHRRASPSKSLREFVGSTQAKCPSVGVLKKALRPLVEHALRETKMGRLYDLVVDDSRERVDVVIVYGGRAHQYLLAEEAKREARLLSFVGCDSLRYDPRTGRLSISTRAASLVASYREALGKVLSDDVEMFADDGVWSLEHLRVSGTEVLFRHDMEADIASVIPRRVVWQKDDVNRVTFDGPNCLALLDQHPWKEQGRLVELALEISSRSGSARVARVSLKGTNRLDVRPERHRPLVERYVRSIGLQVAVARRLDLWSVAEGVHGEDDIAEALRSDIDELLDGGVLRKATRHLRAGEAGDVEEIIVMETEGRPAVVAVGEEGEAARLEDARQVAGYTLVPVALANELASGLKLEGPRVELKPFPLVDLGTRFIGSSTVRVMLQLGPGANEPAAAAAIEARRSDGSRVALLAPDGRTTVGGYPPVSWSLWRPPFDALWTRVMAALGIEDDNPWKDAEPSAKLLIHASLRLVRYLGVDVVVDGSQQFHLLGLLARQKSGEHETTSALLHRLYGPNGRKTALSMLKRRTLDAFAESFRTAGRVVPRDLGNLIRPLKKDGGGYEISVKCQVIP